MDKKLLTEIERMQKLAGINNLNEEYLTREDLLQQDNDADFESLVDQDIDLGDKEETYQDIYGTQDRDVNAERAEEEDQTTLDAMDCLDCTEPYPEAVPTVMTTPAELAEKSEDLYGGKKYYGMHAGERMMEENTIEKLNEDEEIDIDINDLEN
jgi:hypothetical protein